MPLAIAYYAEASAPLDEIRQLEDYGIPPIGADCKQFVLNINRQDMLGCAFPHHQNVT